MGLGLGLKLRARVSARVRPRVRVGVRAALRVRPYLLPLAELAQVVAEALIAVEHLLLLLLG